MKLYIDQSSILTGISLKNKVHAEANNMAFHVSKNQENVVENRKRLATIINQPLDRFVCAQQTHSDRVYKVTEKDCGRGAKDEQNAVPRTDALYTTESNIVLCTFTADCVPLFLYNPKANIIGVVHSGWSGTVKEITMKTLHYIVEKEDCNITDFHIYIGTALSQKRFEVDEDVFRLFDVLEYAKPFITYNNKTNKYHIDNQQVVAAQCRQIGIKEENIKIDSTCTYDSPTGFSYREDKETGRHLGFILQTKIEE